MKWKEKERKSREKKNNNYSPPSRTCFFSLIFYFRNNWSEWWWCYQVCRRRSVGRLARKSHPRVCRRVWRVCPSYFLSSSFSSSSIAIGFSWYFSFAQNIHLIVLFCYLHVNRMKIANSVLLASKCALAMQEALKGFSTEGCFLTLHSGVGAGDLSAIHVGGVNGRFEFLITGNPLEQVHLSPSLLFYQLISLFLFLYFPV